MDDSPEDPSRSAIMTATTNASEVGTTPPPPTTTVLVPAVQEQQQQQQQQQQQEQQRISVAEFRRYLKYELGLNANKNAEIAELINRMDPEKTGFIEVSDFMETVMHPSSDNILHKAFTSNLAIPNYREFFDDMVAIYNESKEIRDGTLPAYIPELNKIDPDQFGIAFCTVDSQQFSHGASKTDFSFQSAALPLIYSIACEQTSVEHVHKFIGREPSGAAYNAFTLNQDNLPHNPLVNTGGIVSCSLIHEKDAAGRFSFITEEFSKLAGGVKMRFDQAVYLSEKANADRNYALAYYMRANGVPGLEGNITDVLDFYFQVCSICCNCENLAVIAATLANGGVCPTTKERCLSTTTVKNCLSMMYSCGMYDYSGAWAFTVGLPAKSGVSGVLMVVIPNVMGIAIYSPKIDQRGNTVRGVDFCKRLSKKYNFSIFDQLVTGTGLNGESFRPLNNTLLSPSSSSSSSSLTPVPTSARDDDDDNTDEDFDFVTPTTAAATAPSAATITVSTATMTYRPIIPHQQHDANESNSSSVHSSLATVDQE